MLYPCGSSKPPKIEHGSPANKGQASLITGASSGLGRELSILFSNIGHVILSGRNKVELEKTASLCKDPHNTTCIYGDLHDSAIQARLAYTGDLYGIRYLILCAGIYQRAPLIESRILLPGPRHSIEQMFETNVLGHIQLIESLHNVLIRGAVVNINSLSGKSFSPSEAVYSATKHAMAGFLKAYRIEARHRLTRVLDVFPGAIQTPMLAGQTNYEKAMLPVEVAKTIFTVATLEYPSLQIEELHLGRFIL